MGHTMHLLCDKTFPGEMQHTSTNPTQGIHHRPKYRYRQSSLWRTNDCGVVYRGMDWAGLTYRGRNDSKTAASATPTPAWVTAHKAGNLELTLNSLQAAQELESVLSRSLSWSKLLPGSWYGLRVEEDSLLLLFTLAGRRAWRIWSASGTSCHSFELFPFLGQSAVILEETVTQQHPNSE